MPEPVVIATWPFGKLAAETALKLAREGRPGPRLPPSPARRPSRTTTRSAPRSASAACPDRLGRLTLDACVMDGKTLACGAVGVRRAHQAPRGARPPRHGEDAAHPARRRGREVVRAAAGLPARGALHRRVHQGVARKAPRLPQEGRRPTRTQPRALRESLRHQRRRAQPRHGDGAGPGQEGATSAASARRAAWPTSCPAASAIRRSSARGCTWTTWPAPPGRRASARRSSASAAASSSSSRCAAARARRRRASWPASGSTPRPGGAASTRPRWRSWRSTRRATSARPAPQKTNFQYAVGRGDKVEMVQAKEIGPEVR